MSFVEPSIRNVDFSCPHCNAHAAQTWLDLFARFRRTDSPKPFVPVNIDDVDLSNVPEKHLGELKKWVHRMAAKELFLADEGTDVYKLPEVHNLHMSRCFSCKKLALWYHHELIYPPRRAGAIPNPDLRQDIKDDIEEARAIIDASPRGAAALLRLAVQKLCVQLGEPGHKIDADIQSLVDKGMDPHLQQAFDAVRVVGNEAVHPGELDLKDDRETAIALIDLINIVAQELITNKKTIASIYARLPASKLAGIEARAKGAARKAGSN